MTRVALALALAGAAAPAAAQAWTPPVGVGVVTLGGQWIDHTGHRLTDGTLVGGTSESAAVFTEVEYGFTDRFAATAGLAYVFARWTDRGPEPPPFPLQPVDTCYCWDSSFQDFTFSARYRLGDDPWAVTPLVRLVVPSHPYETRGEAVVGRNLDELQVGLAAAVRLAGLVPDATLQGGYSYAFVEKVLGIPNDRSSWSLAIGWAPTRRLHLHAEARWQRTHGGLRVGSPTGDPFLPPGEVDTPERVAEHDRLLRDNSFHLGGGASFSFGSFDVFLSHTSFVSGTDTHAGHAWTAGLTYAFGR